MGGEEMGLFDGPEVSVMKRPADVPQGAVPQLTIRCCALQSLWRGISREVFLPPKQKVFEETLPSARYVRYNGCGDGIKGVCICPNSSSCAYEICEVICISSIPQKSCL